MIDSTVTSISRRGFLVSTAGLIVASRASAALSVAAGSRKPVGVQLYCVRRELEKDFEGTMKAVADLGYQGVEFADYFGRTAPQLRKSLDDNGLKSCGTHIMLGDMLGDKLKETIEFNQIIGNPYLIIRWLDEVYRSSPQAFADTVKRIAEISEQLKLHGMRVGYHNHNYIFDRFDGKMLWNILADGTPKGVILQLDTGNASLHEGVDVVELLVRNPGRTGTIHIKPYSSSNPDAYLGSDELNWPRIIELCETTAGVDWYIIEYEVEGIPPLKALGDNLQRFRKMISA
jgi:sugar phosphate isomerase/epimerase